MKTDKITVADLFDKPRRYLVPLFQRGYVWTREGQWGPLWADILHQVNQVRRSRTQGVPYTKRHFLGAFVLNQNTLGVRHTPASDVIDGQQRITTLQTLLIAFRDVAVDLNNTFLHARLSRLTENPPPWTSDDEKFKVWPTSAFRNDFQLLATAGSWDEVLKRFPERRERRTVIPRPQLVEAYLYFHEEIRRFLDSERPLHETEESEDENTQTAASRTELAEELLQAITSHIQLVEISLDVEDDAQVIFETLNARGAPLTPSDLVRNFVFLYATRKQEDVAKLYEKYWRPFDETPDATPRSKTKRFWKEEERQGRLKSPRLDLFLFHYLTYRLESEIKLGHVFQEFRDWWEKDGQGRVAERELERMWAAAEVFRAILQPDSATPIGRLATQLKVLDSTTFYPLILFLAERQNEIGPADFAGMLLDLESYVVRRAVCDLTTKGYNRIALSLIRALSTGTPSRARLREELLRATGESAVWPDDDTFRRHFTADAIYQRAQGRLARLILESIERESRTSKQEGVRIDGSLSVEHVWPRNPRGGTWTENYQRDDGSFNAELWARHQRLKHSVGNLTLVTPSFNSSLSNASFAEKRPAIMSESLLLLNKYFLQFLEDDAWDEAQIERRATALFEVAVRTWPRPSQTAST